MSTPTSLDLPDGVRRTTIHTARGAFAALEAVPASGVCEREAAREPAQQADGGPTAGKPTARLRRRRPRSGSASARGGNQPEETRRKAS